MSRKVYLSPKEKKHIRNDSVKVNCGILNSKVASDVKRNSALKYNFDDPNYKNGINWFNSGLSLEDAPKELRNNGSFIMGFKKGQHNKIINDAFYETGIKYSRNGIPFDKIEEKYKNNEYFMNGYNSCKGRSK